MNDEDDDAAGASTELRLARAALDDAIERNAIALRSGGNLPVGLGAMLVLERRHDAAARAAGIVESVPTAPEQVRDVLAQMLLNAERNTALLAAQPDVATRPQRNGEGVRQVARDRRPIMWE